jgi:hypothetical protein
MSARLLSLLFAVVALICSCLPLLAGLFWGLTMKCGDSCSSVGGWRHDPDAWQWNGIAALGAIAFLSGLALVVLVWLRRPISAAGAVAVGLCAVILMANAFSSNWMEHLGRHSPSELLLYTAGVFAPIFAVLLSFAAVSASPELRDPDGGT